MKILLITYDFFPKLGGIAYTLINICKNLRYLGYEIHIFNCTHKGKNIIDNLVFKIPSLKDTLLFFTKKRALYYAFLAIKNIITNKNIPFTARLKMLLYFGFKPRIFKLTIDNLSRIYPYLIKDKYDVVLGGSTRYLLPLTLIVSRNLKIKAVSIAHGTDFLTENPFKLKSYYYRYLDKTIVTCNQMKLLIKKIHNLNEEKIEIIHLGVNLEDLKVNNSKKELRKEFNIPENQFVLLSVGRHNSRKKFDLVIKAINEIKKKNPLINIKYYLIGDGVRTNYLKNLTNELDIADYIHFLGTCDKDTRNKFYVLSDVFIMPSITTKDNVEGFGIVFLEANYLKVPVIGAATGGVIDAIVDKETGLLVKPNNLKDLIEKILYLYEHEDERKRMGENGHERVITEFTWDIVISDYDNLLKKINNLLL